MDQQGEDACGVDNLLGAWVALVVVVVEGVVVVMMVVVEHTGEDDAVLNGLVGPK